MKAARTSLVVTLIVAMGIFAVFLGMKLGADDTEKQAIAAWVQAVGSIGAILAGFWGVRHQLRVQEEAAKRAELRRFRGGFTQILLLAHEASDAVDKLKEMLGPLAFQEYADASSGERSRKAGQVQQLVHRIAGVGESVSDLIRSADTDLEHVNLLLRLQRSLQNIGQSLAGVRNPLSDLYPSDIDYDAIALEIKGIRFSAGSISAKLETNA